LRQGDVNAEGSLSIAGSAGRVNALLLEDWRKYCPPLEGSSSMAEITALFEKWKGWIKNDLQFQVQYLILDQRIFDAFNEAMKVLKGQEKGGEIAQWIGRCHFASVCLAIRRLGDKGSRTISLRRLLSDIAANVELMDEDTLTFFTPIRLIPPTAKLTIKRALEDDLKALTTHGESITHFVDKMVAHYEANVSGSVVPPLEKLKGAIDCYQWTYRKWAHIIVGMAWQADNPNPLDILPPDDDDYKEQFLRMFGALREDD
jgi:AbiU2